MDHKGSAFFASLLQRVSPSSREKLLSFLKDEERENISMPDIEALFPFPKSIVNPSLFTQKIHYSWIAELLKEYPQEIKPLFLSLFPPKMGQSLAEFLKISYNPRPQAHLGKLFLLAHLKEKILPEDLLAEELIPFKPLSLLLNLTKNELVEVINLLGMFDIAGQIPKILDKNLLRTLYSLLKEKEQEFLKKCLKKSTKWQPLPLALAQLVQDKRKFKMTLHNRGLTRLAFAVSQEEKDYIWHLTHLLDTGRATKLEEQMQKIPAKNLNLYFQEQVFEAVQEIKLL